GISSRSFHAHRRDLILYPDRDEATCARQQRLSRAVALRAFRDVLFDVAESVIRGAWRSFAKAGKVDRLRSWLGPDGIPRSAAAFGNVLLDASDGHYRVRQRSSGYRYDAEAVWRLRESERRPFVRL